jgi:hypothetical protein
VGVLADGEGRLIELSHAHQAPVRSVAEDPEDHSRLVVWFWGYSPVCLPTPDHPAIGRIRTTLERAVASGQQVWVANWRHMIEGETEIWWKILDVRPS